MNNKEFLDYMNTHEYISKDESSLQKFYELSEDARKKLILTFLLVGLIINPTFAANNKETNMKKITQTAGRDNLENFAPEFAHFNDDILFGEN